MTDINTGFLAEITRFLQDDELDAGFPVEVPIPNPSLVLDNSLAELACAAADQGWSSNNSCDDEPHKSSRVTGTKRVFSDERELVTKRRQIYRQRAKGERESLRYEVAQLSTRLSVLMEEFKKKNDNGTSDTNSIPTWKTIALCRQTEHQQAEDERNQLQSAVETQRFFIQQFRVLLLQQLSQNLICDKVVEHRNTEQKKDGVIFRAQMAELNANFACSDDIFVANEMILTGERPNETSASNPDGSIKCIEFRDKQEYPFEFQPSRDSVWEIFHCNNQQKDRERYTNVTDPDNTYAFKFRVTRQLAKDTTISLLVRLVIRRYTMNNQMMMVWRTFTEGEGIFSGIHCSDSGWSRIRPFERGTTMETYAKLVPANFNSTVVRFREAVSILRSIRRDNETCIRNGMTTLSTVQKPPSRANVSVGLMHLDCIV